MFLTFTMKMANILFFVGSSMAHYGDPDWYNKYIYPLRDAYTQPEKANVVSARTARCATT